MRKYFPYILFIFLFFIYFLCYQSVLSHVIYYQEQHHLFLYSKTFFSTTYPVTRMDEFTSGIVVLKKHCMC